MQKSNAQISVISVPHQEGLGVLGFRFSFPGDNVFHKKFPFYIYLSLSAIFAPIAKESPKNPAFPEKIPKIPQEFSKIHKNIQKFPKIPESLAKLSFFM
jgi:hypothetical protein